MDRNTILSQVRFDGFITGIYLNGTPTQNAVRGRADAITYDAEGSAEGGGAVVSGVTPYNRSFSKASIISAQIGDYCDIIVDRANSTSRLYVSTEKDDLVDCDKNPIEDIP